MLEPQVLQGAFWTPVCALGNYSHSYVSLSLFNQLIKWINIKKNADRQEVNTEECPFFILNRPGHRNGEVFSFKILRIFLNFNHTNGRKWPYSTQFILWKIQNGSLHFCTDLMAMLTSQAFQCGFGSSAGTKQSVPPCPFLNASLI